MFSMCFNVKLNLSSTIIQLKIIGLKLKLNIAFELTTFFFD